MYFTGQDWFLRLGQESVGTVTPMTVSAEGVIQVRGSGFVAGLTATIGGKAAACSVLDSETLSCTVPNLMAGATAISWTNPNGQTYSFGCALVVQLGPRGTLFFRGTGVLAQGAATRTTSRPHESQSAAIL
jgi:hypothetical protein